MAQRIVVISPSDERCGKCASLRSKLKDERRTQQELHRELKDLKEALRAITDELKRPPPFRPVRAPPVPHYEYAMPILQRDPSPPKTVRWEPVRYC